LTQYIRQILS